MGRRIGIVHNEPIPTGKAFSEASIDILAQVEAIEKSLEELGYQSARIPFQKDLNRTVQRIAEAKFDMVFNLCESVDEDPRLIGHPAAVLELLGIPFSGSPSMSLMVTTDKVTTKQLLKAARIKTPNFAIYDGSAFPDTGKLKLPVIVKPRFEDASIGIDQESVFSDVEKLDSGLKEMYSRFGPLLVEEYIDGREFNISLFGYPSAKVLPIAEIEFSEYPEELFRIVGYRAKWDASSFESRHTRRAFPNLSRRLRLSMERVAVECYRLFMLRDYARVDVRVDARGRVYVLEVNANPCLSPDAGFAAAVERAGMKYSEMVGELLDFLVKRSNAYGN
jgi:D-alanine-D-alanine ligase